MPTKVSKDCCKDDCLSPRNTERVELCDEFSEPKSGETKSVELCEGGSSETLCHTSCSSATSSQATVVVVKVETPPCSLVLSGSSDQGVGEFVTQPLPEVHVPAGCEIKTCGTVRADFGDENFNLSVPTSKKSSEVKTNAQSSVVELNDWLINMLLLDYLSCMLLLIIGFIRSLQEYLSTLPWLQRLRLQRGCKLFSVMHSPPPLISRNSSRCEFFGGRVICLNESTTQTPCWESRRCGEHGGKKYVCGCLLKRLM